jgi:hypothetical protein
MVFLHAQQWLNAVRLMDNCLSMVSAYHAQRADFMGGKRLCSIKLGTA